MQNTQFQDCNIFVPVVPFLGRVFQSIPYDCPRMLLPFVEGVLPCEQQRHRPYQQHKQVANVCMTIASLHGPSYSPFLLCTLWQR